MIEDVPRSALSIGDLNNDGKTEIIITRKNFARILTIKDDLISIIDQINSPLNGSVSSVVPISIDGKGDSELILFDSQFKKLLIMQKNNQGRYESIDTLEADALSIQKIHATDLDGDGKEDILLKGRKKFSILSRGAREWDITTIDSYETKIKDGRYAYLRVGDFTAKGSAQIILLEAVHNILDFLNFSKKKISHAVKFKVFEEGPHTSRTDVYGERKRRGYEPRELTFEDMNKDGIPDLVIVIHDRIIVYFQEQ
jgi:hypothetical protein